MINISIGMTHTEYGALRGKILRALYFDQTELNGCLLHFTAKELEVLRILLEKEVNCTLIPFMDE